MQWFLNFLENFKSSMAFFQFLLSVFEMKKSIIKTKPVGQAWHIHRTTARPQLEQVLQMEPLLLDQLQINLRHLVHRRWVIPRARLTHKLGIIIMHLTRNIGPTRWASYWKIWPKTTHRCSSWTIMKKGDF